MLKREKVNKDRWWVTWGNIRPGGVSVGYGICHHMCPIAAPIKYTWVVDHITGSGANATRLKVPSYDKVIVVRHFIVWHNPLALIRGM